MSGGGRSGGQRVRGHLARKEFDPARALLEAAIGRDPEALGPRVILAHALLQEGRDWDAAEGALREVLAREPGHAEARRSLAVLLRQQGRAPEESVGWPTLAELYRAA